MAVTKKSLRVALPDALHDELRAEAERSGRPTTAIARDAIREYLDNRRRQVLAEEISTYAQQVAGSSSDLDPMLEQSSLDYLASRREA